MNKDDSQSPAWRITLPCSREQAAVAAEQFDAEALGLPPMVLTASEPDGARPENWQLDVYCEAPPSPEMQAAVAALAPDADAAPLVERLEGQDWVTLSQAGLHPIREGRFFVSTRADFAGAPAESIAFRIEAGRAFGTGHHETTAGCLAMIDRLARSGPRFREALDLGTGTGVLAFAMARALHARVIATDIDPVSIEVARENAADNGLRTGRAPGAIELVVADGTRHRRLDARAPYDIITANILAGPLIAMARGIGALMAPGGTLILAGLLRTQAGAVRAAYSHAGCHMVEAIERGDWSILRLRRPRIAR